MSAVESAVAASQFSSLNIILQLFTKAAITILQKDRQIESIFVTQNQKKTHKFHTTMITLTKRLRGEAPSPSSSNTSTSNSRISIRDKLLVKEVQEMESALPSGCKVKFDDPNALHDFTLTISPDEGFWTGGKFRFHIHVSEDYNLGMSLFY